MSRADDPSSIVAGSDPAGKPVPSRWRTATTLSARLTRAVGMRAVCDVAVGVAAQSIDAAFGSIAVVEEGKRLAIRGTYGYPRALVEQGHIELGASVIGQVLQTGRRVLRDGTTFRTPAALQRARYRTGSFMALPVRAAGKIIGILCLADPNGRDSFASSEVSRVTALLPVIALALARERNAARAAAYVRAATIDVVSGLFNRRYFRARLEEELERSRRQQSALTLMMIDVDDFKRVNDSFGHLAGDGILCETADIVRRSVRLFDVCTRFGGDEFAIIMPGIAADRAGLVAERIRSRVEKSRVSDVQPDEPTTTVSIGLTTTTGSLSARGLVAQADQALYRAKRAGRNCVRVFEDGC